MYASLLRQTNILDHANFKTNEDFFTKYQNIATEKAFSASIKNLKNQSKGFDKILWSGIMHVMQYQIWNGCLRLTPLHHTVSCPIHSIKIAEALVDKHLKSQSIKLLALIYIQANATRLYVTLISTIHLLRFLFPRTLT